MIFGVILLIAGLAIAIYGHQTVRMQTRAIGAGLAAFGAVSLVLHILVD